MTLKRLSKTILYGEAESANQWIYKGHWGYNPAVVGYPYNPEKAKKLLAEAGYPNGFKTKLLYRTSPENDQIYTAVQGYLKAVGIDVELDPSQSGRYDQIALRGGKWEGLIQNGRLGKSRRRRGHWLLRYSGGGGISLRCLYPTTILRQSKTQ